MERISVQLNLPGRARGACHLHKGAARRDDGPLAWVQCGRRAGRRGALRTYAPVAGPEDVGGTVARVIGRSPKRRRA